MCGLGWEDVRRVWFQEDATACAKGAAWRNTASLGKESVSMSAAEDVKKQRRTGEGVRPVHEEPYEPCESNGDCGRGLSKYETG